MIEGLKLNLTLLNSDDFDFYASIYSNKDLLTHVCNPLDTPSVLKCFKQTLKQHQKAQPQHVLYVIRQIANNEAVGVIGLRWNQESKEAAEIGVIIIKKHQRKGYAHEAKNCLIEYAFNQLKLNEIVAICKQKNTAANAANVKLGFQKQALFINEKNKQPSIRWQLTKAMKNG